MRVWIDHCRSAHLCAPECMSSCELDETTSGLGIDNGLIMSSLYAQSSRL